MKTEIFAKKQKKIWPSRQAAGQAASTADEHSIVSRHQLQLLCRPLAAASRLDVALAAAVMLLMYALDP